MQKPYTTVLASTHHYLMLLKENSSGILAFRQLFLSITLLLGFNLVQLRLLENNNIYNKPPFKSLGLI